jgi:hypothetical protein
MLELINHASAPPDERRWKAATAPLQPYVPKYNAKQLKSDRPCCSSGLADASYWTAFFVAALIIALPPVLFASQFKGPVPRGVVLGSVETLTSSIVAWPKNILRCVSIEKFLSFQSRVSHPHTNGICFDNPSPLA